MQPKIVLKEWSIFFVCRSIRVNGKKVQSTLETETDSLESDRKYTTTNIIRRINNNELIDDNFTTIVLIGDCVKNNEIPDFFNEKFKNGFSGLWKNYISLWRIYKVTNNLECFDCELWKRSFLEMRSSNTNANTGPAKSSRVVDPSKNNVVFELNFQYSKAKSVQKPLLLPLSNNRLENETHSIRSSTSIRRTDSVSTLDGASNKQDTAINAPHARQKATASKSRMRASERSGARSKPDLGGSITLSQSSSSDECNESDESDTELTEDIENDAGLRHQTVTQRTAAAAATKRPVPKNVAAKKGVRESAGRRERGMAKAAPSAAVAIRANNENKKNQRQQANSSKGNSSPKNTMIKRAKSTPNKSTKRRRERGRKKGNQTGSAEDATGSAAATTLPAQSTTKSNKTTAKTKDTAKKANGNTNATADAQSGRTVNDDEVFKKPLHPAPRNSMSSTSISMSSNDNSTSAKKRKYFESNFSLNSTSSRRKRKLHTVDPNSQILLY